MSKKKRNKKDKLSQTSNPYSIGIEGSMIRLPDRTHDMKIIVKEEAVKYLKNLTFNTDKLFDVEAEPLELTDSIEELKLWMSFYCQPDQKFSIDLSQTYLIDVSLDLEEFKLKVSEVLSVISEIFPKHVWINLDFQNPEPIMAVAGDFSSGIEAAWGIPKASEEFESVKVPARLIVSTTEPESDTGWTSIGVVDTSGIGPAFSTPNGMILPLHHFGHPGLQAPAPAPVTQIPKSLTFKDLQYKNTISPLWWQPNH